MNTPTISGPSSQFTRTYKASLYGLCISKSKPGPLPTPAPLSVLYPTPSLFISPSLGVSSSVARPAPPTFILTTSLATSLLRSALYRWASFLHKMPSHGLVRVQPCARGSPGRPIRPPCSGALTDTVVHVLLCSRCPGLAITRAASSARFPSAPPSPAPLGLPSSCSLSVTPQQHLLWEAHVLPTPGLGFPGETVGPGGGWRSPESEVLRAIGQPRRLMLGPPGCLPLGQGFWPLWSPETLGVYFSKSNKI